MLPVIEKRDGEWKFIVDGKPFVMLAGELHNSASSDAAFMEEHVWPYLRDLHMNSVLVSVPWELIEAEEDTFDFSLIDEIIKQARREKLRLGILWFGLWKNGISSYIPAWMKKNTVKYPRVKDRNGRTLDIVTPFSQAAIEADAKAFSALMRHLKEVDGETNTVIMVQVENEMGILGSDRDYSVLAEEAYKNTIPKVISEIYGKEGTWQEAFASEAPELFMEYQYALATEQIAKAGKEIYPLPMITNAWLRQFPYRAGGYPSGGPIAEYRKVWKKVTPHIDVNAPDVYISDFKAVCEAYVSSDNPLMIPEHRRDIRNISHIFYALGKYQILCFSPFGIEDMLTPPEKMTGILGSPQLMKMLNIDPAAWSTDKTGAFLQQTYPILEQMIPMLDNYRKEGRVYAFLRSNEHEKGTVLKLRGGDLQIDYLDRTTDTPKAAGIVVEAENGEIYVIGVNFRYSVMDAADSGEKPIILEYSEGRFEKGDYVRECMLNGDERFCMLQTERPKAQCMKWVW